MYQRALQGNRKAVAAYISRRKTVNNSGLPSKTLGKLDQNENIHQRTLQRKDKTPSARQLSTLSMAKSLNPVYFCSFRGQWGVPRKGVHYFRIMLHTRRYLTLLARFKG
jgi:hypothetical protein